MTINLVTLVSMFWVVLGAIVMYWVQQRARERGVVEGIKMHHEGRLTYDITTDNEGVDMINIEIAPYDGGEDE